MQNCHTYQGALLGITDHCLVAAKIVIRLKATKTTEKPREKIETYRIQQDPALAKQYHVEIYSRFEVLTQCDDSEGKWKVFKENTLAAATSVAGMRQLKKKDGISNGSLAIIDRRREVRLRGDMTAYRQLNKERNIILHKDRKTFIDIKVRKFQEATKKRHWSHK